jgi:hypothetical protein
MGSVSSAAQPGAVSKRSPPMSDAVPSTTPMTTFVATTRTRSRKTCVEASTSGARRPRQHPACRVCLRMRCGWIVRLGSWSNLHDRRGVWARGLQTLDLGRQYLLYVACSGGLSCSSGGSRCVEYEGSSIRCDGDVELRCNGEVLARQSCENGCTPGVGCNDQAPVGFACSSVECQAGVVCQADVTGCGAALTRVLGRIIGCTKSKEATSS